MPQRIEALKRWLENELDFSEYTLNPASSDASFRRYFRVGHEGVSYIIMDAPPDREDTRPFVTVDRLLFDVGLNVPEIIDENPGEDFFHAQNKLEGHSRVSVGVSPRASTQRLGQFGSNPVDLGNAGLQKNERMG